MSFLIPTKAIDQHIAILGKTGSGKSYTARGIVEHLLTQSRQVCIVDPTGAHWGLRLGENGKSRPPDDAGQMTKGERQILAALIQYPEGLRREQLTVLTGYKRSSRDTYIQRLRERGYCSTTNDYVAATPAGNAALPDAEPLPRGEALQSYWLSRLGGGERAILERLIGVYPESVDKDALSEATGYQRSSRDTYLQRLRARQLVEEPGRGVVQASRDLFE